MKLSVVLREIQDSTKTLNSEIYKLRNHVAPAFPIGTVGPQGPVGDLDNYSDGKLLEMIREATRNYLDARDRRDRLTGKLPRIVEAYRETIAMRIPELKFLIEEPWELR